MNAEQRGCRRAPNLLWKKTVSKFVHAIEQVFFKLGELVALNPWKTILLTLLFVGLSGFGFFRFHLEKNPMKLWVPPESDFYVDTEWYMNTFGSGFRLQSVILTANNVLEPEVIKKLYEIHERMHSVTVVSNNNNVSLQEICFKVPVIKYNVGNLINDNQTSSMFEPSVILPSGVYCGVVENFEYSCYQNNILDIWRYDKDLIESLNRQDILDSLNSTAVSPTIGIPVNYNALLGQVDRDSSGRIITAKSILTTWFVHVDFNSVDLDKVGNLVGTEDWVTIEALAWESEFLKVMQGFTCNTTGYNLYYQAGRSYGDISGATMFQELDKLFFGIALMFIYIQIVLSGWNWLEIRLTLGSIGLLSVGLAYFTACSWSSVFGIPYGPIHASLPFLLMGLGIDDMFVMKACWEQLTEEDRKKSFPVQIGLMLQHAGVSIVITSFTDIVALLVGSITILPSLKSFCFYAAFGVFFIFCFSVTFYVAVFALDEKRIIANRNGVMFCYKHTDKIETSKKKSFFQRIFAGFYKHVVFTVPVKVMVISFTIVMTAFSIESVLRLEQRFDPDWFIPDDTYFKQFLDKLKFYYPNVGQFGFVFLGQMNYSSELPQLYQLAQVLRNETSISGLTTWVEGFHNYVSAYYNDNFDFYNHTEDQFNYYLSKYLYSPSGGKYQQNVKFSSKLICGEPAPDILATSFQFRFVRFSGPNEYIPAMNKLKSIVQSAHITTGNGYRSVWSKVFANWATDEIIAVEVERNVELALLCVMGCTIFLITDLQMCLWIFICVLLTLINVCGWMQRWGMTVDIVSCIGLELAIGLCVDYAAHVGHTFLTLSEGSRYERSFKTVTSIGMAVLYGGGSTLLSLSVLSMSKAYTFSCFFKIFLLVIIIGLFHGLIFLPVVLSLIGPKSYLHNKSTKQKSVSLEVVDLNKQCSEEVEKLNG